MKTKLACVIALILGAAMGAAAQTSGSLRNPALTVRVRALDGSYEIFAHERQQPVVISRIGAELDHQWLWSTDYHSHRISESAFHNALGTGRKLEVTFHGLARQPDLVYDLKLYDQRPYGDLEVRIDNTTDKNITVQDIRVVDAVGAPRIDLGGQEAADRVMAEVFSENPTIQIGNLAQAPHADYMGVRDELIYNQESKQSLLLAALTTHRFLTICHLHIVDEPSRTPKIGSLTVDSTGTTEVMRTWDELAQQQRVRLSLPVTPGATLGSEQVMFAAGPHYLNDLENYGEAVRRLHHALVMQRAPMGWWSWTAFYAGINAGEALTNARWLAAQLKSLGYRYFHIDEGYEYAYGEYATPNATHFPNGMWVVEHEICNMGLIPAIWTAPFEVSGSAWVYEHHKDWLVHDAHGKPIFIGYADSARHIGRLYVLDTTNPGAQAYLRDTYRILTRQWGLRYIKLDFMDNTAIEGYYFRPHTTALEAQRIGLRVIRQAVGPDVLLDKDGSVMLNPVGLVNEGRIATDTGHSFTASKEVAPNIAARFYMNGNFFIDDPDAFSVSKEVEPQQHWHQSKHGLTFDEAEVQIVLAALTGGMYEIGDDLPTLGLEPKRLALVKNQELIDMNRLGKAALPLDLMTFRPQDEQPSVFFLREDTRQAMFAVFNWTEQLRSHEFTLAALGLPAGHPFHAFDVMNHDAPVSLNGGTLRLENQPPHSVRVIKLVDSSIPAAGPNVSASVPGQAHAGHSATFSADADASSDPAVSYHWDFGDGTDGDGSNVTHTYTVNGTFTVRLMVAGVDGLKTHQAFTIIVTGFPNTSFNLKANRRYTGSPGGLPQ
jgi:alpha-galactosidase